MTGSTSPRAEIFDKGSLEYLATLIAIEAPERMTTRTTYVRRDLVLLIRLELERRGVDWRAMVRRAREIESEQRKAARGRA